MDKIKKALELTFHFWEKVKPEWKAEATNFSETMENLKVEALALLDEPEVGETVNRFKPCPFCGGEAVFDVQKASPLNGFWSVICVNRDTCGATLFDGLNSKEATKKWNTRVPSDRVKALVEAAIKGAVVFNDDGDIVCQYCDGEGSELAHEIVAAGHVEIPFKEANHSASCAALKAVQGEG